MGFGQRIKDTWRAAGEKLGEFDDMYAKAIRDTVTPEQAAENPFNAARGYAAGFIGMDRNLEKEGLHPAQKAVAVSSRYVLPAAGVTAAGMALYDLTNQFGGPADQPEQGQLGMG